MSIVVIGHGSGALPAPLQDILDRTTYQPVEILRADLNGGDRGTVIDAVVGQAAGELVCLLEDRAIPVRSDWLGSLVDALLAGPVAVGPLQVLRPGRGLVRATQRTADLTILSAGIDFARVHGLVRPAPLARGDDPLRGTLAGPEEVPALSLTCLLVRRDDFALAGGYPTGYLSDDEEADPEPRPYAAADLACRLRRDGRRMVCDRRALVLVASSPVDPLDHDRDTFVDRFGPRIGREVLADILEGAHRWSRRPLRLAIVETAAPAAPRAPTSLDWRIEVTSGLPGSWSDPARAGIDVLLVTGARLDIHAVPGGVIRVAWVVGDPAPDIDDYDVVVADAARAATLALAKTPVIPAVEADPLDALGVALGAWNASRRFAIRIGASNWPDAPIWGDYHFARSLQRCLERAGHPTTVRLLRDWGSEAAARDDVTIHLFGRRAATNRSSQVNILWQISHPEEATPELYDSYDLVYVASERFARSMAARTRVTVTALDQATDPERFSPDPTGPGHELLYVANFREDRPVLEWLLPTDLDLAVYGRGWAEHGLDPRHLRGDRVPNAELGGYYGSASIVLNDTWADMREAGFISNRIYDVLASGGFVISDDVAGIGDEFAGAVPVYHDAAELRALVARYLADPVARRELAARGREIVLARHTFEQRARSILAATRPLLDQRPGWIADHPESGSPSAGG